MDSKPDTTSHKLRNMIVLMVLTVIYAGIMNRVFPPEAPFNIHKAAVLRPDTIIQKTQTDISTHNGIIRDILVQQMVIENDGNIARESSKMQTRGFYLVIIAALLAFLIKNNSLSMKTHSRSASRSVSTIHTENRSGKQIVFYILPIFIMVVFALEVHQDDLNTRFKQVYYIYSDAVRQLCDSSEVVKTWQVLDYSKTSEQMNKASEFCTKWPRVMFSAVRPTADQIVLYFLPFIAIMVMIFSDRKKS